MNVNGIHNFFSPGTTGADRSLILKADHEFNLTLKLGQVLKGKVLRHYEGGRYGVSFNGQERVVDSTVPLRVGDTVQGRVVAIDDQVHLQRIVDSSLGEAAKEEAPAKVRDEITNLFARYGVKLTQSQHQALTKLARPVGNAAIAAQSALIVHKLGLPQEPELIAAIYRVLDAKQQSGFTNTSLAPQMPTPEATGAVNPVVVQELAPLLERLSDDVAHTVESSHTGGSAEGDSGHREQSRDEQWWQLGQWLLNIQGEGSLAHRYLQFPLWLDDRMVEVSMALYSQNDGQPDAVSEVSLRHHKAVFSLETENLGRVEIEARVADRHLRLTVDVEHEFAAERLAEYLTTLTSALNEHDWRIDEIRYGIRDEMSGVMRSVVEHHVTPDSLSQLM